MVKFFSPVLIRRENPYHGIGSEGLTRCLSPSKALLRSNHDLSPQEDLGVSVSAEEKSSAFVSRASPEMNGSSRIEQEGFS